MTDPTMWNDEGRYRGRPYGDSAGGPRGFDDFGERGDYRRGSDYGPDYGTDYGRYGNGVRSGQRQYGPDYGQRHGSEGGYQIGYNPASGGKPYRTAGVTRPGEERTWWDRTNDEVSSWMGDDEAARRRRMDEMRADEHRGRGPRGYTRSDDRIREDVNDCLTENGRLDASDIDVKVSNCEVTLNGTVDSRDDKRRAEDLVERISGVKQVQNNLRVQQAGASETTGVGGRVGPTGVSASAGGQTGTVAQSKAP